MCICGNRLLTVVRNYLQPDETLAASQLLISSQGIFLVCTQQLFLDGGSNHELTPSWSAGRWVLMISHPGNFATSKTCEIKQSGGRRSSLSSPNLPQDVSYQDVSYSLLPTSDVRQRKWEKQMCCFSPFCIVDSKCFASIPVQFGDIFIPFVMPYLEALLLPLPSLELFLLSVLQLHCVVLLLSG